MEGFRIQLSLAAVTDALGDQGGAAFGTLLVGALAGVLYIIKIVADIIKGKPQQELAERKERRAETAGLRADLAEANSRAEGAWGVVRTTRVERDLAIDYARNLRTDALNRTPGLRPDDLRKWPPGLIDQ